MARIGWILYDPVTEESYTLPTNPHSDSGSFGQSKGTSLQVSGASFYTDSTANIRIGDTLIVAAPDEERRFAFSGNVYSLVELDALTDWAEKDYQILLTDDLRRTFEIFITEFSVDRVRSSRREKHAYTLNGIVFREIVDEE